MKTPYVILLCPVCRKSNELPALCTQKQFYYNVFYKKGKEKSVQNQVLEKFS